MSEFMAKEKKRIALVLTGGGARAAFQAGALKAISDMTIQNNKSFIDIYCGVSAGAINATHMAINNHRFHEGVNELTKRWSTFHAEDIYFADEISVFKMGFRWFKALMPFYHGKKLPTHFLDNTPLKKFLSHFDYPQIKKNIENNILHAISITCSSYHSGQSVIFFQGMDGLKEWFKPRRIGVKAQLEAEHLIASAALPLIFPAQKIKHEYFGDGSMRQTAPLSSAIHLGAEKIILIGAGRNEHKTSQSLMSSQNSMSMFNQPYPTLAQIGGYVLNGLFLDGTIADMERLKRTNEILEKVPPYALRKGFPVKKVELLSIIPEVNVDEIANQFINQLPYPILKLLKKIGASENVGGSLTSYLLFEQAYCQKLLEIGYETAWKQKEEILEFLNKEK